MVFFVSSTLMAGVWPWSLTRVAVPFLLASLACPPLSDVKRWGQRPSTEQPLGSHKLPLKVRKYLLSHSL